MMLLFEETSELVKAVRKNATNMVVDIEKLENYDTNENEAADVLLFYYLYVTN